MASDMGAVIGGSIAGGVVLLVVLSVVLYLLCGKRKHRKRREQRKFRPLSPGVSPAHSQPSTLGHAVQDGRLPKVNSTGLWIGAPSLYSGSPSQAYFYGRPPGKAHRDDRPLHIPRAASETRIPQPKGLSAADFRPPPPRRSQSMTKVPLHPGAQRFYHSQQLAPVFEVPPSSGMEIYDVYQFGGGFGNGAPRSKLLETKHSPYYYNNNFSSHNHNLTDQFRLSSRLERSQSDAQDRASPRRGEHRRQGSRQSNSSSSENRGRAGSREKLHHPDSWASEEARRKRASKSLESLRENGAAVAVIPAAGGRGSFQTKGDSRSTSVHSSNGAHVNAGFTSLETHHSAASAKNKPAPSPVTSASPAVSSPSTPNGTAGVVSTYVTGTGSHSSNKTSARSGSDTSNNPSTPSISPSATDSMKLLSKNKTDDQKTTSPVASIMVEKKNDDLGTPMNYTRYDYGGDVYTMPAKGGVISERDEDDYDNPIVNRMKQMVLEKSRSNPTTPRAEVVNTTTSSSYENGVYEEVTKITKVTRSEVIESVEPERNNSSKESNSGVEGGGVSGSAGGQNTVDLLDGLVLPDILEVDKKKNSQAPPSASTQLPQTKSPADVSSSSTALKPTTLSTTATPAGIAAESAVPVGTSKKAEPDLSSPSSPAALRPKEALSPRASDTDDINKAGKRITASAFEFLEQYLSDDEGTEASHVDSPPLSPTGIRAVGDLVY